jgi:hypothetical protein
MFPSFNGHPPLSIAFCKKQVIGLVCWLGLTDICCICTEGNVEQLTFVYIFNSNNHALITRKMHSSYKVHKASFKPKGNNSSKYYFHSKLKKI